MPENKIRPITQIGVTDGVSEIGSPTERMKDISFIDENGASFSVRGLAASQRRLRDDTSILSYTSSQVIVGGVWTYTITDSSGIGVMVFDLDEKILVNPSPTMSVNIESYAGTDSLPKDIHIYVQNNGADLPELVASNTSPEGLLEHANVSIIKAGTVSASSATIYAEFSSAIDSYEFIHRVYNRFWDEGTIYRSGLGITASSSDLTIGVGSVKTIFELISTTAATVSVEGHFFVKNDGTYNTLTDFAFTEYSTGETIGSNKYYNVVFGIVHDGTSRILALVQKGDAGEYVTLSGAYNDSSRETITAPNDEVLKRLFVPVCRVIVKQGSPSLLQEVPESGTGVYYLDLRGETGATSGSASSASNVVDGNILNDTPFWNPTTGLFDPKTIAEAQAIYNYQTALTNGVDALTIAEVDQLENIGSSTISATQWGYLGNLDQNLRTIDNVTHASVNTDLLKYTGFEAVLQYATSGLSRLNIAGNGNFDGVIRVSYGGLATTYFEIKGSSSNTINSTYGSGVTKHVWNNSLKNVDLAFHGSGATDVLYLDAGNRRIGINKNNPATALDLNGTITTTELRATDQPYFNAYLGSDVNNISSYDVVFNTERLDRGGDYNNTTGVFTAPANGLYMLSTAIQLFDFNTTNTDIYITILTSNKNYRVFRCDPYAIRSSTGRISQGGCVYADMEAGDTAHVNVTVVGDAVANVNATETWFMGGLAC